MQVRATSEKEDLDEATATCAGGDGRVSAHDTGLRRPGLGRIGVVQHRGDAMEAGASVDAQGCLVAR